MSFLQDIARHYAALPAVELQSLTFVFPNRRAGLFFRRHLAKAIARPAFAPQILTINQLFQSFSHYNIADPIDLLLRLYNIYSDIYLKPACLDETFDDFFFWGRMMLSDFNEVDMHLVDAKQLFSNLADNKDIDIRFSQLGDDSRTSIQSFLKSFSGEQQTPARQKFMHIWRCMFPIYNALRQQLQADNIAYMGMLCREVVESGRQSIGSLSKGKYVFAGFNALTEAEKQLMLILKEEERAQFWWDYSHQWLRDSDNCASLFCQENLSLFPDCSPQKEPRTNTPILHLLQIPSSTGQARETAAILSHLQPTDWTQVGVVLPDEKLLQPVLCNIPANVENVNITMGLSLQTTPVYSLLQHLSELQLLSVQRNNQILYYHKPVISLLSHPYLQSPQTVSLVQKIHSDNLTYVPQSFVTESPLLSLLFNHSDSAMQTLSSLHRLLLMLVVPEKEDGPLTLADKQRNEYIYQTITAINRLHSLLSSHPNICPSVKTLYALLCNIVADISVPFEGEPLAGLQIMGMLESRSMAFDTLIITDVNDEILPGHPATHSYIPYDMRKVFGLPTPERQDAVYAYNFYRLLSEAKEVWLLQNTITDERNSGEESRFVLQLQHQYHVPITRHMLSVVPQVTPQQPLYVEKTPEVLRQLALRFCPAPEDTKGKGLSPSALNTYVSCPLRFYLEHVCRFGEADKIEESIAPNDLGTVLHETMRELYNEHCGNVVTKPLIEDMRRKLLRSDIIEQHYRRIFLRNRQTELEGKDRLPLKVVLQYALRILDCDATLTPFTYIASEKSCRAFLPIEQITDSPTFHQIARHPLMLKGIIDRVDKVGGNIRIIDYKTGSQHCTFPKSIEKLYSPNDAKEADHIRQTLFYCYIYNGTISQEAAQNNLQTHDFFPYIYYVRNAADQMMVSISEKSEIFNGYASMHQPFSDQLVRLLKDITNPDIPFIPLPDINKKCKICPFNSFCN